MTSHHAPTLQLLQPEEKSHIHIFSSMFGTHRILMHARFVFHPFRAVSAFLLSCFPLTVFSIIQYFFLRFLLFSNNCHGSQQIIPYTRRKRIPQIAIAISSHILTVHSYIHMQDMSCPSLLRACRQTPRMVGLACRLASCLLEVAYVAVRFS
jgi:hypothetical protein